MKSNTKSVLVILITVFAGMVEVANAFYDPGLQRWINRDPIGERGGLNLFTVVNNDSQNKNDPNGECPLLPWFIAGFVWGAVMTPDIANAPALGDPTYGTTIGDRMWGGLAGGVINVGIGAMGGGLSARNTVSVSPETLPPGFRQVGPNTWVGTIEIEIPRTPPPGRGPLGPPPPTWDRPIGPPPPPRDWSCN